MTIAICLKVGDGIVLGADSASTLMTGGGVENVYFNAEKIFNLRKGLPIGAVTYGLGGIGGRSVNHLAKDLRRLLTEEYSDWYLSPETYTMEEVAQRVRAFFHSYLYVQDYPPGRDSPCPPIGFTIAGYSAGAAQPEVWSVEVDAAGVCPPPRLVFDRDASGVAHWNGQPEALNRLFMGYSDATFDRLVKAGVPAADATNLLVSWNPLARPGMPIQDAIDLVQYMADVTVGFVKFSSGAPVVAPPIDLVAITVHERFRWVRRKHYYAPELKPD